MGGISGEHWLGLSPVTGTDLFCQIVYGIRTSLFLACAASLLAVALSTGVGIVMGYFGGVVEAVLGRLLDFLFGFPGLLFVIALMVIVPSSFPRPVLLVLVLAFFGWPPGARVIGAEAKAITARDFVEAARSTGAPHRQIIARELLPHLYPLVVVLFALSLPAYVSSIAGLSFLGLGLRGDTPDLGKLLADSLQWIYSGADIWYMIFPGAAIFLFVLGATLAGDVLRDLLDVRGAR